MADLSVMGFLNEETQQETEYNIKDAQARNDIGTINGKIPSGASSSNKMATASDITDINNKIPSNASSSNKLATISDVSAAYKPKGNATLGTLPTLTADHLNWVYNMTEDFTTTSDFAEGAGKSVKAGNEVGIIDVSTTSTPSYKYTVLGGFIDTSGFQNKTLDTPITVDGTQKTTVETALQAINTLAAGIKSAVGTLSSLTTTVKTSIVAAINELVTSISGINEKIPSGASSSNKFATASDVTGLQNNIIANTKLIKDTVGWSGKNKYLTRGGERAVIQSDGTVNTSNDYYSSPYVPVSKNQIISYDSKTGECFYRTAFYTSNKTFISRPFDSANNKLIEIPNNAAYMRISVEDNANAYFTNLMCRDADILDDTYEEGFGSTAFPRSEQAVLGARNVAPQYTMASGTVTNGITVTYDENSVVNLNGTASADGYINLRQRNTGVKLPADGRYRVSGYVNNNCYTFLLASDGTILASSADSVTKGEFDYTSANENFGLIIFVRSGTVLSNQKVYPMITLASDADTSFSAPAMTNKELTEKAELRTVTPTVDGTIVKTYKGGLVAYNLLTRVCTFCMRLEVGAYANYTNFVTDLPKSKNVYSFPCVCTNFSRNVGMAVLTTSANGGMYFTGLGQAANFADGDEINISGSYIIADDVVS